MKLCVVSTRNDAFSSIDASRGKGLILDEAKHLVITRHRFEGVKGIAFDAGRVKAFRGQFLYHYLRKSFVFSEFSVFQNIVERYE